MKRCFVIILTVCALSIPPGLVLAETVDVGKAKAVDLYGTVQQQPTPGAKLQSVNVGDTILEKTTVSTGENSALLLQMPGDHMLRIGAGTKVTLKLLGKDRAFSFNVLAGRVWSFVRRASKPTKYEIETPSAVVGVSGTVFNVFHNPITSETSVSTNKGVVSVRQGNSATVPVTVGNMLSVKPNGIALAKPVAQTPQFRRMWFALNHTEQWMTPTGGHKISHGIERLYSVFSSAAHGVVRRARGHLDGTRRPAQQPKNRRRIHAARKRNGRSPETSRNWLARQGGNARP